MPIRNPVLPDTPSICSHAIYRLVHRHPADGIGGNLRNLLGGVYIVSGGPGKHVPHDRHEAGMYRWLMACRLDNVPQAGAAEGSLASHLAVLTTA